MRRLKFLGPKKVSTDASPPQRVTAAPAAASAAAVSEKPQCEPLEEAASYLHIAEKYLLPAADKPLAPLESIEYFVLGVEAAQKAAEILKTEKQYIELKRAAALLNAAGIILQTEAQKYIEIVRQNAAKQNSSGPDRIIPHPPQPRRC